MTRERAIAQNMPTVASEVFENSFGKIIAIGELDEWTEDGNALPSTPDIAFLAFDDVDEAGLMLHAPDMVYSPVLARDFDCIELATLLHNVGFTGTYRAVGNGLPKPELIEREVRQMCPRIKFEIVEI